MSRSGFRTRRAGNDVHTYRAVVLDEWAPVDARAVRRLRRRSDVTVAEDRESLRVELAALRPGLVDADRTAGSTWAWYPWRRTLVAVPPASPFRRLRLDRNRSKITQAEQDRFSRLHIGVVGLSVGHAIAQAAGSPVLLATSDRIRFLTPLLHRQMMDELRWPGSQATDGIDVTAPALDAAELAKLEVAARSDVMEQLGRWGDDAGAAPGDSVRDRVNSSSAVAVVTVDGDRPADYVRGGMAVEHLWIRAEQHGLAVHPVSPVFRHARDGADLHELSAPLATELGALQRQFTDTVGLGAGDAPVLVLRLGHEALPAAARSRRLDPDAVGAASPAVSSTLDVMNRRES
jgi:hypothetical protein